MKPIFPASADLEAVTRLKPLAPVEIVTSEAAAERHSAAVEAWGEGLWRAGGRICRWAVDNGMALAFACPARPIGEK